jgi:hypothetical protein
MTQTSRSVRHRDEDTRKEKTGSIIMPVVPQTIIGRIEFYEQHLPVWALNPTAIGLSAAQVADLTARTIQARADYEAAQAVRNTAKAATMTQNDAVSFMHELGGDLVKTIRAFAETTDDTAVYAAAEIPAPQPPTPPGPPDQPTALDADILLPFGIGLTWKGSTAQSTYFGIWRKLDSEVNPVLIKTTKNKSFDDRTLPDGTNAVDYYIAAYRDDFEVNSATLRIQIGANGATSMTLAA